MTGTDSDVIGYPENKNNKDPIVQDRDGGENLSR